jgi:DNA polymerase elongation subunit (family B)
MKIPLSMYAVDDGILIYRNGQIDKAAFPFKPFALVEKGKIPNVFGTEEVWRKVPEDEDRTYLKMEFNTPKDLMEFKKRFAKNSNHIFINSFIEQIYISEPDFFLKYPHTNVLKIMFFDIEVASKGDGLFPKPTTNEILCVGYSVWEYYNDGSKKKITHKICKGFDPVKLNDKPVIDDFFNDIQKYDPDILAGYYSDDFDLPYLIERGKIVGSNVAKLCRGGREPVIGTGKENKIRLPGRIHFDIFSSNSGVLKDQTLFGIKSKTLKDLGRWYKIKRTRLVDGVWVEDKMDDIEIKENMEDLLKLFKENPDLLYAYQDDDVYRTEGVGNVYLRNCITLAEMMHVSLDSVITMYSSLIPKLLVGRAMNKLKMINTETNFQRYNIQTGTVAKVSPKLKYEGALTGLYRDGYIPSTWKIDFACVDNKTEILTDEGWKLVPNIKGNEKILTYHSSGSLTFQKINKWNIFDYKGKLIHIKNRYIDQMITPNHRCLYKNIRKKDQDWKFIDAEKLPTYIKMPVSGFSTSHKIINRLVRKYAELIPWIITEGNITNNNITISQRYTINKENCKILKDLFNTLFDKKDIYIRNRKDRPDTEYTVRRNSFKKICKVFDLGFRRIPTWIYHLPIIERRIFIDNLIKGDGHKYTENNPGVYISKEEKLIDDIQLLCHITGMRAIKSNQYTDKRNGCKWYYLHITNTNETHLGLNTSIKSKAELYKKIDYIGKVYCPSIDNGTFIIKRNGKISITGNSMYPSSIQTWNLGPDTTKLVSIEEYTGKYNCKVEGIYNWYRIPTKFDDNKYAYDFIVRVRNDKEGFLKQEIARLKQERKKIKAEMKLAEGDAKIALYSQQWAIKIILNCFHPDTTILTEHGIRLLKDVKVGDLVWSINPNTFKAELKPVEKTYEYDIRNQNLYHIEHQRFSQMVTEGHKMLGYENNKCFFEEAKDFTKRNRVKIPCHNTNHISKPQIDLLDLVNYENYEIIILHKEHLSKIKTMFPLVNFKQISTIKNGSLITTKWNDDVRYILDYGYILLARPIRSKYCSAVPIRVNTIMFSKLVGWYLSEGSMYTSVKKEYTSTTRGITNKITIAQDEINKPIKDEMFITLKILLNDSKRAKIYRNLKQISFSSDLYAEIIDTFLGRTTEKYIDDRLINYLNITSVLDAMYQGDGTKRQRKYTISQKYQKLFNSYINLLILDGRTFNYYIDSGCYRIVDSKEDITLKNSNTTKIKNYTGKVYSLTVKDNHTVYAGLNGKMSWIGQSIYGFLGMKSTVYGDMTSATMVTSMCRWCTMKMLQQIKDTLVEADTDGYIITTKVDADAKTKWLAEEIIKKFNLPENFMELETEGSGDRAYFYKTKNYIIENAVGDYTKHGASLKSSKLSKVVDRAIQLGIDYVFNNKPIDEVIHEAYNFKGLTIEDFTERVKMTKDKVEYNDQLDHKLFLAKQVEEKTGQVLTSNAQISYVILKDPLPYPIFKPFYRGGWNYTYIGYADANTEVDTVYYTEQVDKALEKFGISRNEYIKVDLFNTDPPPKKPLGKDEELDTVYMGDL